MTRTRRKHVAVAGGGLAGLAAAYALTLRGHVVTLFEATDRLGGRAWTLGPPLADGLVAEAGAARFPADFHATLKLVRRFGLDIVPFYPANGSFVAHVRGTRICPHAPESDDFWGYSPAPAPGSLSWSERATRRIRASVRRARGRLPWKMHKIRTGFGEFTDRLAIASGAEIRLATAVRAIRQARDGVRIEYEDRSGEGAVEADYAVSALPLSTLAELEFDPPLGAEMRDLSLRVPFSSAVRTFLQMKRPFWRDHGCNGFAVTDTVGEVWDPHFDDPREPALLVCYAQGDLATGLARVEPTERLERVLGHLDDIFPGASSHFELATSVCWTSTPRLAGGWPLVDGFQEALAVFRSVAGRILFVGDYAPDGGRFNSVEGAIGSAMRAAVAIDRSP